MFDFLENILSTEKEEIETKSEDADKLLKKRKGEEIESAKSKEDELKERTGQLIAELDEALEQVKEYEDEKDLKVVEDVTENFYRSRKKMLKDFEQPEDLEEHVSNLKEFITEFNDVSRKEGEVMKRVERRAKKVPEAMNALEEHATEIEDFIDGEFSLVKSKDRIQGLQKDIKQLEDETDSDTGLSTEIEQKNQQIKEKKSEIESLKDSNRWKEMKVSESEVEEVKQEVSSVRQTLSRKTSKMERGLKKLLYSIENADTEFSGSKKELEKLKEQKYEELEDPDRTASKAVETAEESGILDSSEMEKFESAVENTEFSQLIDELQELNSKLEEKQQKAAEKSVQDELKELKREKSSLENQLQELEEEREKQRELKERKKQEIKDKEDRIEQLLNRELQAEVELRKDE